VWSCIDTDDLDRSGSHSCSPSVQNTEFSLDKRLYVFTVEINRLLHNPAYPKDPRTLGERIRKARMDKGLLIRELAALVGVTADTVLNWELRGVKPMGTRLKRLQEALEEIASGLEGPQKF
jgi:DNA-binding XRE family transcriptional regulator